MCGIPDSGLRERLLREQDLDLEKALMVCRATETVKTQAKELSNEISNVDIVGKHAYKATRMRNSTTEMKKRQKQAKKDRP